MKTVCARMLATAAGFFLAAAGAGPAEDLPITIKVEGRTACVKPSHRGQARAEGGDIEMSSPAADAISATLTGAVAANAYLGCPGSATETFQLVQEFEIKSSDTAVRSVRLTLDSALVGYLRSKHNAGASVRLATASVCPIGWEGSPLVIAHPPQSVGGKEGQLCNQNLTPLVVPGMPLGRYVLKADFVLTCEAAGLVDGHSNADFTPSSSLPTDWVRSRDPFQGVDKKNFGFSVTLTAEPNDAPAPKTAQAPKARPGEVVRTSATVVKPRPTPPARVRSDAHGYERSCTR